MEPAELPRHACDVLERLKLLYLVTGSSATIAYGEPRFTNDIDIVVDLPASLWPRVKKFRGRAVANSLPIKTDAFDPDASSTFRSIPGLQVTWAFPPLRGAATEVLFFGSSADGCPFPGARRPA